MKLTPRQLDAVMSGKDRSAAAVFFRCAAACAEPVYRAIISARNAGYDRGWRQSHRASLPVISIGNITTGGVGKTPFTAWIAHRLIEWRLPPAILMRGYGAEEGRISDEQTLLAEELPGVPVVTQPDRVRGAAMIAANHPQVKAILLDDGFQHRRLARDLDLVLIDATNPFGHGHLLPRGLLREPAAALRRAGGVILSRAAGDTRQLAQLIERYHGKPPLASFTHEWDSIVDAAGNNVKPSGGSILAACAIGNPQAFFDQARGRFEVADSVAFPDHHDFKKSDLARLEHRARQCDAQAILVTGKDWVKLRLLLESQPIRTPIWRPILRARCCEGQAALEAAIRKVIS